MCLQKRCKGGKVIVDSMNLKRRIGDGCLECLGSEPVHNLIKSGMKWTGNECHIYTSSKSPTPRFY